jgi:hypothetical protein
VLTTPQVVDIGFCSLRKPQGRPAFLYAAQVVDRFRFYSWSDSSPYHFALGAAGAAVVAAERGVSVTDLGWHRGTGTPLATNRQLATCGPHDPGRD